MSAEALTDLEFYRRGVPVSLKEWTDSELQEGLYELRHRLPSDEVDNAIAAFEDEVKERSIKKG